MKCAGVAIGVAVLLSGPPLQAQTSVMQEVETRLASVEEAVRALGRAVSELNTLLRAALPPSPIAELEPVELSIATAATKGSTEAKFALIEFTDFECPFCGRHAQTSYRELQRQFVESGQIRYPPRQ